MMRRLYSFLRLARSIAVVVILWLAAPAIADFYSQPTLIPLTRLLVFVLPLGALAAVPDALLTQRLDFKARAKAEIIASLCSGVIAVVLAWRGLGVWSLAGQAIIAISMRTLLLWLYSGWRPCGRFRRASFHNLFGFGGYMLLSGLLDTLSIRLQSLLIGKLFNSRTLGYYTLAQNTQQAPTSFMGSLLNRVGLPVFSIVADQPAKFLGALRLSLRVAMFLFVPCMLGIAVIAKPLIIMLYGARWATAAPLLSILALSATFWPLHILNLAAFNAQGSSNLFFRLALIKKVVMIGLICVSRSGWPDRHCLGRAGIELVLGRDQHLVLEKTSWLRLAGTTFRSTRYIRAIAGRCHRGLDNPTLDSPWCITNTCCHRCGNDGLSQWCLLVP